MGGRDREPDEERVRVSVLRREYGKGESDPVDSLCDAERGGVEAGGAVYAERRNSEEEKRIRTAGESLKAEWEDCSVLSHCLFIPKVR